MTDLADDVARVLARARRLVPRYVPFQDRDDVVQTAMLRVVPLLRERDTDKLLRLLPRLLRWVAASTMSRRSSASALPDEVVAPETDEEPSPPIDGSAYLVLLKGVQFRVVDAVLQGARGTTQIGDRARMRRREVRAALSRAVQTLSR